MNTTTTRLDYFATNAPAIPAWFSRKTVTFDSNDPAGVITRWAEPEEEHFIRWRWHYANLMIAGGAHGLANTEARRGT